MRASTHRAGCWVVRPVARGFQVRCSRVTSHHSWSFHWVFGPWRAKGSEVHRSTPIVRDDRKLSIATQCRCLRGGCDGACFTGQVLPRVSSEFDSALGLALWNRCLAYDWAEHAHHENKTREARVHALRATHRALHEALAGGPVARCAFCRG